MSVNFTNYNNQYQLNPELQKRLENGNENFGALDREKLRQDTAEFADKTKQTMEQNVQENGYTKLVKKGLNADTKKKIKSFVMALVATVGLAVVGNKTTNIMAKAGLSLDNILANNKIYTSIGDFFKKIKTGTGSFLKKSKTIQDITDTLQNRKAKQKNMMARGYGRGIRSIFALTPPDIIKKALSGVDATSQDKIFNTLVGSRASEIQALLKNGNDNVEFCNKLTDAIADHFNCKDATGAINHKKLLETFEKIQKGEIKGLEKFKDVVMADKGAKGLDNLGRIMGDWWPVNLINAFTNKISKGKIRPICLGNLGDSLIKYNAVNGTLAKTAPAKFIQQAVLDVTEMPSNFVNDKSGFGVMLCLSTLPGLFSNVQDAPKDKKFSTVANDFVGSVGSMVIAAPIASGLVYGAASLKNLKGTTIFSKMLKPIGKVAGLGLDKIDVVTGATIKNTSKLKGFAGGAMRFVGIMFVLMPMIQKPVTKFINKIFGKPYDAAEAQREKQIEEQKNTIIPEFGITQGELMEKINNNPKAVEKLQQDPALVAKIQANPKLLVDYLDGKDITQLTTEAKKPPVLAPINQPLVNSSQNAISNEPNTPVQPLNQNNANNQTETVEKDDNLPKDTATYIPSSKFKASATDISSAESQEIQEALSKADKVLKKAEQYL